MATRRRAIWALTGCLLVASGLVGCPSPRTVATSDEEGFNGQVLFPGYRVQADIAEVATAATVSLIDPDLNQTKATSLTDANGRFSLVFRGISPGNQVYYLEAVKGLNSNSVGKDAVRVRTLIQRHDGAWASLNSVMPGTTIVLNTSSTALSLIVSLRQATAPVTPSLLIGTLAIGGGGADAFSDAGTGVTAAEFAQVRGLAAMALAADTDPFYAVEYAGGTYSLRPGTGGAIAPTIHYLQPAMASLGEKVVIRGAGFASSLAGNQVTFAPGVGAVVATASANAIEVTVPAGAASGELRVTVGSELATTSFALLPPISGGLNP